MVTILVVEFPGPTTLGNLFVRRFRVQGLGTRSLRVTYSATKPWVGRGLRLRGQGLGIRFTRVQGLGQMF